MCSPRYIKILSVRVSLYCCLILFYQLVTLVQCKCPNWCSSHGHCSNPSIEVDQYCICDIGFTGEDCSLKICPKAYDMFSLPNPIVYRTIELTTELYKGKMNGLLQLIFGLSSVMMNANSNDVTNESCKAALMGWKAIADLSCEKKSFDAESGIATYIITLLKYPTLAQENNIFTHNGNPSINFFSCNTSFIDKEIAIQPSCQFSDSNIIATSTKLPLYAECSNHGDCNKIKGYCSCHNGYHGVLCDDTQDREDIIVHSHDGPFYTGTVLKVQAIREPSSQFNLFQTKLKERNVTTVRGDLALIHEGDMYTKGSFTIGSLLYNKNDDNPLFPTDYQTNKEMSQSNIRSYISNTDKSTNKNNRQYPLIVSKDNLPTHFQAISDDNQVMFQIDSAGNIFNFGNLNSGSGTFIIESGLVTAESVKVLGNCEIVGTTRIADSLTIGSTFTMTSTGMKIDIVDHSHSNSNSNSNTAPVFELTSRESCFTGSLMELKTNSNNSTIIKTVVNDFTTFELLSSGIIKTQGMKLLSGGVEVLAGGVNIEAGGLKVQGGMSILSGGLSMQNQSFTAVNLLLSSSSSGNSGSGATTSKSHNMLQVEALSSTYMGTLIDLESASDKSSSFSFLQAKHATANSNNNNNHYSNIAFEIEGSGFLKSTSGASFSGSEGLTVHSQARFLGNVVFQKSYVSAGAIIDLTKSASSYVVINNDYSKMKNEVLLMKQEDGVKEGQLLILSNQDEHITHGDIEIPPFTTVLLVYDGSQWVDIQVLRSVITELKNIQVLEAADDLYIGNVTFAAGRLQSTRLKKGNILLAGPQGVIYDTNNKLTFSNNILQTPALKVDSIESNIDLKGNIITNAQLHKVKLTDAIGHFSEIVLNPQKQPLISGNGNYDDKNIISNSGVGGSMAYFDTTGKLTASDIVHIDEKTGNLIISEFMNDVDFLGNSISNVTISASKLLNISEISVASLKIPYMNHRSTVAASTQNHLMQHPTQPGSFAIFGTEGIIESTQNSVVFDTKTNTLHIENLGNFTLLNNTVVDFNHQIIKNVNLVGGSISNLNELQSDHIIITSLANINSNINSNSNSNDKSESDLRVVFVDKNGKLVADNYDDDKSKVSHNNIISLPSVSTLNVSNLQLSNTLDGMNTTMIKNIKLDSASIDNGIPQKFHVGSLIIDNLNDSNKSNSNNNSTITSRIVLVDDSCQLQASNLTYDNIIQNSQEIIGMKREIEQIKGEIIELKNIIQQLLAMKENKQ